MSTRAMQQVDATGRPGNRLIDLRARARTAPTKDTPDTHVTDTTRRSIERNTDTDALQIRNFATVTAITGAIARIIADGEIKDLEWISHDTATTELVEDAEATTRAAIVALINALIDTWWGSGPTAMHTHAEVVAKDDRTGLTIDDHDPRYWPHAGVEEGNPDDKSYNTTGDVTLSGAMSQLQVASGGETAMHASLAGIQDLTGIGGMYTDFGAQVALMIIAGTAGSTTAINHLMTGKLHIKSRAASGTDVEQTGDLRFDGVVRDVNDDQVLTERQTLAAYTAAAIPADQAAYTGIDNTEAGTVYAQVSDLNALRAMVNTLAAQLDAERTANANLRSLLVTHGLLQEPAP